MDITVYLPDGLGERAKKEELNLSRMLREAVIKELDRREAMTAALDEPETYEIEIMHPDSSTGEIRPVLGRITGRKLFDDGDTSIYLTSDKRVLAHYASQAEYGRLDDPPEDLVKNLREALVEAADNLGAFIDICNTLGAKPVIDL